MLSTLVHEIAVYPFLVKWIPTILKRIVIGSLLTLLFNITYLVISVVQAADENNRHFLDRAASLSHIGTDCTATVHSNAGVRMCSDSTEFKRICDWLHLVHVLSGKHSRCSHILNSSCKYKQQQQLWRSDFLLSYNGIVADKFDIDVFLAYWYKQRVRDSDETQTLGWRECTENTFRKVRRHTQYRFLYLANIIMNLVKKCNAGLKCEITNV